MRPVCFVNYATGLYLESLSRQGRENPFFCIVQQAKYFVVLRLTLQLLVLIDPLHCCLQCKVVGGTLSWKSLIELGLMGEKIAHLIFGILAPQGILWNPLPTFLGLK